jgi:hypothetical protein
MPLTRENTEMPIYCGLGVLRTSSGKPRIGNRNNAIKIAERMAKRKTAQDHFVWTAAVWTGVAHHRISFCAQKERRD